MPHFVQAQTGRRYTGELTKLVFMEVSMNLLNLDKQKALKLYIACISEFGIVI